MSNKSEAISLDDIRLSSITHLPTYNFRNPSLWFGQVESVFCTHGIRKQLLMFAHVAQNLPPDAAEEVSDLINNVPEDDPYDKIKAALINRTGISEQANLDALFANVEIGDRKPSQLLRHMRKLLGTRSMDDAIFRHLWMKKIPLNAQNVLAACSDTVSLEEIASIADRILQQTPTHTVSQVAPARTLLVPTTLPTTSHTIPPHPITPCQCKSAWQQQMADLTSQMNLVLATITQKGPASNRDRSHSRARSKSRTRLDDGICWYHRRYGNLARKCTSPCTFVPTNLPSGNSFASQ